MSPAPPDPDTYATCPLCGSGHGQWLQEDPDFSDSAIYKCSRCDFWFAAPVPADAALRHYYQTIYSVQRTWIQSPEYLALMERRAVAQRAFLGGEAAGVRRALDVGCGVGALVANFQRAGIDATGFDSDSAVISIGRQRWAANIHVGDHRQHAQSRSFDLVCLSHVVEHFPRPLADLRTVVASVRPGGLVFVEVPNCIPWMFAERVPTESHLGFFTTASLRRLAAAAGLDVVRIKNCGPEIVGYYTRARQIPAQGFAARVRRSLTGRLHRAASGLAPQIWPVRTEYDGWFDRYHEAGNERGLWLRALFRRRADDEGANFDSDTGRSEPSIPSHLEA